MRIGIGNTVPERSNLPGQSGGGIVTPDEFIFEVNAAIGDTIDLDTRNNNAAADFIINWGEGSDETVNATTASHTYTSSGTKVVKINKAGTNTPVNDFEVLATNQGKSMVTKVTSWGNNEWYNLRDAFRDCVNLETLSTDTALKTAPITSQLFYRTFKGCTSLQAADMTNWVVNSDTSNAAYRWQMQETFENCSSLALVKPPSSKVMPVSLFNSVFKSAGTAVTNGMVCELQGLDFSSSSTTSLNSCFINAVIDGNNSDFSDWVFSSTSTSLTSLFYLAQILGTDPILDCSGWTTYEGTSLRGMFRGVNYTTTFNNLTLNISNLNVQNVNDMYLFLGHNYSKSRIASIIGLSTWGATAGNVNFSYGFAYSEYLKLTADDNFSDTFINSLNPINFTFGFTGIGTSLASNFGEPPNLASLDLSNSNDVSYAFHTSSFSSLPDFSNVTFPTSAVSYYSFMRLIVTESFASHLDLSNKTIKPTNLERAFEGFKSANKITFPSGSNSDFSSLTTLNYAFYNAGSASAELEVILPTDADYSAVTSWTNTFVGLNGPGTDTLTTCVGDTLIRRLHATSLNANQQSLNLVNTKLTGSPSIVDSNVADLETAGWVITSNSTDAVMPFVYTTPLTANTPATPSGSFTGGEFSSSNSNIAVDATTGEIDTPNSGSTTIRYTITATGCYNEQAINVVGQLNNVYSMAFDGINDYIDTGAGVGNALGNSVSDMTISMWVNITPGSSNDGIFKIGAIATDVGEFSIRVATDARIQAYFGASTVYRSYDVLAAGNWNHIAIVKQGTTVSGYVNGSLTTPAFSGGNIPSTLNFSNKPTFIGLYWNTSFLFNGKIDEVGIFNTALTGAEVQSIYNATETGKTADLNDLTTPPIVWYRMGD